MDTLGGVGRDRGTAKTVAMRRGSYDDAVVSLRPHLRNLAQRRRSAPSLALGKALGMPWSPIREEASCWATVDQCPFVLGLSCENGALLLDECVQVTEGNKTKDRHLFLFSNVLIFAKLKSSASYRLKHRVNLEDIWLFSFDDDDDDPEDEDAGGDVDLRVTLLLAWASAFCMVCFRSPEVKGRWQETLHRTISEARAPGVTTLAPRVLMKVLGSGSLTTTKTLTGVGMEPFMEFPPDGDAKISALCKPLYNQEERVMQPIEHISKWNILRRLRLNSTRSAADVDAGAQLFGLPLCKICPDGRSLPKPVTDLLVLLWKKGPSTEGVFRKPGNNKSMRDIRDQLNAGVEVDMEEMPVVLLVALLKCFLKELPGSLLVSELYDTWVNALDVEDRQRRASLIKSVLQGLPEHNSLLLQHLLCVLRRVLERSDTNKMDARNLAICIGPTLLQLNSTPLEEQKDKLDKVTELTQYLIEHCCDLLGENILNLLGEPDVDSCDSLSSQLHDSAYDSTDPDADGDPGESASSVASSFPALPYSSAAAAAGPSCKPPFNRRSSEPTLFPSAEALGTALRCLARSHDDCSLERKEYHPQPPTKQTSDSALLRKLEDPSTRALAGAASSRSSSCSLESAASNQSEGSVCTGSPRASPTCLRKSRPARQAPGGAKPWRNSCPASESAGKRRSQSMKAPGRAPKKTGGFSFATGSLKRAEAQKDNPFSCGPLLEDSRSEAKSPLRPRPLSAIEAVRLVDSGLPNYEQAVQSAVLPAPPHYRPLTVQDAQRELGRRSRPASANVDFPVTTEDRVERRVPFRQRAASESVSGGRREAASRRCSQPVFEEHPYTKESYV